MTNETRPELTGPTRSRRIRQGLTRLSPLGRWTAGVASGVAAALVAGWVITVANHPGSGEPFTLAVTGAVWQPGAGFVTAVPAADVPERPNGGSAQGQAHDEEVFQAWEDWVRAGHAVRSSGWGVMLTIQGTSDAEVTLIALKVRVVERRDPVAGIEYGEGGGDPTEFRRLVVDLDQSPPRVTSVYDKDWRFSTPPPQENRPIDFPYRVSISDAETFIIRAQTVNCDCSWVMELTWASQGKTGTRVIDDNGQPFRTTSEAKVTRHCAWFYAQDETCYDS